MSRNSFEVKRFVVDKSNEKTPNRTVNPKALVKTAINSNTALNNISSTKIVILPSPTSRTILSK